MRNITNGNNRKTFSIYNMNFRITIMLMKIGKISRWRGHMVWYTLVEIPNNGEWDLPVRPRKKRQSIVCYIYCTNLGVRVELASVDVAGTKKGVDAATIEEEASAWYVWLLLRFLRLLPTFSNDVSSYFAIVTKFLLIVLGYKTIFFVAEACCFTHLTFGIFFERTTLGETVCY